MSDVRIKVPSGMLKAVETNMVYNARQLALTDADVTEILEAALRWLSENPIVPTDADVVECARLASKRIDDVYEKHGFKKTFAIEWQRRMFLATEEPKDNEFMECELCRAKPGSPTLCRSCLHNRNLIEKLSESMTSGRTNEPEVPEEIKDMLISEQEPMSDRCFFRPDTYNERLVEAFRRGQQSAKK